MDPVGWIAFWAVLFLVTHVGVTTQSVRPRLVTILGDQPYLGVYSLISFATFIPLVVEFARNKHAGTSLWFLRDVPAMRGLAIILMLLSLFFTVASFITPSPASIGAQMQNLGVQEPRG